MAQSSQRKGMERRRALGAAAVLASVFALCCPAAWAQSQIGGFSGLSGGDSKKPIDIESDRLEVDDKKHTAIFFGNVSVTQGDNNLKAPRLEVFYENANQAQGADKGGNASKAVKPVKSASASAPGDPISSGQIKLIHASGGKVVVTSAKDGQEATGDDAIYDVKAQLVTLSGKEVVLSQGPNKVKGTKLQIDLDTGKATMLNAQPGQGDTPAAKPRIRAIFQQETGADGKVINPLTDHRPAPASEPKKSSAEPKKSSTAPAKPARKPAPQKESAAPAPSPSSSQLQDWQPENH
jgi:lipopolysaccharide export system protein LptA